MPKIQRRVGKNLIFKIMKKLLFFACVLMSFLLCACDKKNEPEDSTEQKWANGVLPGKFSVSADKQVNFSQGNLQATTTDLGTKWTWIFADNQYDYIGDAVANNVITGNGTVSSNGTVDQFGWSTAATYYGIHNSKEEKTYSGDFVDWGVNVITNGGNKANLWRTLTADEWGYLFFKRTNAATLLALGSVNGVNGVILLPDNWTLPKGVSFTNSGTLDYWDLMGSDSYEDNFSHNTYTISQWTIMESSGAVFLAGTKSDGSNYWTATGMSEDGTAICFWFCSQWIKTWDMDSRYLDYHVRLVKDVE